MSLLYRQYTKVVAKWPLDEFKSHARNLRNFLETDIEKSFQLNSAGQRYLINEKETNEVTKKQSYEKKLKGKRYFIL